MSPTTFVVTRMYQNWMECDFQKLVDQIPEEFIQERRRLDVLLVTGERIIGVRADDLIRKTRGVSNVVFVNTWEELAEMEAQKGNEK